MFAVANLAYLAVAAVTIIVGAIILKMISARADKPNARVSLTAGYTALSSILVLWGVGFIALGAGLGWNPHFLN